MKVCVLGAEGQLGHDICAAFLAADAHVSPLTHREVEITSPDSVRRALQGVHPDLVVNCAAFTHVERCESEPAAAFSVNAVGAHNIAKASYALGAALMHISTDYVFDGAKRTPYVEQDAPLPLNVYGNSKLAGEYFVRGLNRRHFVLRVSGIYGHHPCRGKGGLNFVEMMLKLAAERDEVRVVDDERTTPTPTVQVARQAVVLAHTADYGLYHASCEGSCSWYEFARAIFDLSGAKVTLERAQPGEFAAKVLRPKYSVMENAALKQKELSVFSPWQQGLKDYLLGRPQASTATPA